MVKPSNAPPRQLHDTRPKPNRPPQRPGCQCGRISRHRIDSV